MNKPISTKLVSRLCALDGPNREVDFMLYGWQHGLPPLIRWGVKVTGESFGVYGRTPDPADVSLIISDDAVSYITGDLERAIYFVEENCPDAGWLLRRLRHGYVSGVADYADMFAEHAAQTPALALLKAWAGYEAASVCSDEVTNA